MMLEHYGVTEENWRDALDRPTSRHFRTPGTSASPRRRRSPAARWSPWQPTPSATAGTRARSRRGGLAREYGFTDVDGSRPDAWRYLVEVQDAGMPPNPDAYR